MINLLPEHEKRRLRKESRQRTGIAAMSILLVLEICMLGVLVGLFLMLTNSVDAREKELFALQESAPSGAEEAKKEIAEIKSEILTLRPASSTPNILPSEVFVDVIDRKPAGIALYTVAFAKVGAVPQVQVGGIASTREALIEFQKNLRNSPRISDVKSASQNPIIKKTDVEFNLTITVK